MFSLVLETPSYVYVCVCAWIWTCTSTHLHTCTNTRIHTQSMKEKNLPLHHPHYRKHERKIQNSRAAFFTSSWLKVWADYIDKNVIRYSDYFIITINITTITNTNTIYSKIYLVSYKSLVIIWKCILDFCTLVHSGFLYQLLLVSISLLFWYLIFLICNFSPIQLKHFKNHFSSVFKLWIFLFIQDLFPC